MDNKVTAIIVAGGTGERMKSDVPKQFLELGDKPVIIHTIEKFEKSPLVSDIVIVCHESYIGEINTLLAEYKMSKVDKIVPGGETRQESSFIGIKNCPRGTEYVLIHDAVRPFVDERLIRDVIDAAKESGASAPAVDIVDTVMLKKGDFIEYVHDRNHLKRIQTPQGFKYDVIYQAHEEAAKKGITGSTDDCGLVLAMKKGVKIIEGSSLNIKLTEQIDLFVAERIINEKKI